MNNPLTPTFNPAPNQRLKANQFIKILSQRLGFDILQPTRKQEIREARQIAQYLINKHCKMSLAAIGKLTGKGHATIIHRCKRVEDLIVTDRTFKNQVEMYQNILLNGTTECNEYYIAIDNYDVVIKGNNYHYSADYFSCNKVEGTAEHAIIEEKSKQIMECIGIINKLQSR
jgi:hypothetical protein